MDRVQGLRKLEVQPSDDTSIAPPEPDLLPVRIDESVFAGFANHQYAQIQTRILDCFAPACDAGIASSAFPNLRNNIGVDQMFTDRRPYQSRARG